MNEVYNLGTLPPGPCCFEASTLGLPVGVWPQLLAANGKVWKRINLDEDGAKYQVLDGSDKMIIAND